MQVRFLLGPAGTGKTFRCLEEIRAELKRDPAGAPLLFLAPKQATFQIERQLLADPDLRGYTRLQILSFDRLAEFVLDILGRSPREILSDEGRVMILRALLSAHHGSLKTFRGTARLPGFAQQFASFLRELQHEQLGPERMARLAAGSGRLSPLLRDKLHDAAILLAAYQRWLKDNNLEDAGTRVELATASLERSIRESRAAGPAQRSAASGFQLWLDGFAEMTPQELNLLAAVLPCCERATLAFCLEAEPTEPSSWLSLWTVVAQTFRQVRARVDQIPGVEISFERLKREDGRGRFACAPALRHLESNWSHPSPFDGEVGNAVVLAECADMTAEAIFAAREIRRFVREGGRYRECAVLTRTLERYHDVVRRVFTRYGIPMFLDRRETVTHHPLAELTRFALRLAAYGWQRNDWFGALKTGLVDSDDAAIDELENEALAHGWEREQWLRPLPETAPRRLEELRARIVPPFVRLADALRGAVNGSQIASAIRALWAQLGVEDTLDRWTEDAREVAPLAVSVHGTVRDEIGPWLENVERAFPAEAMALTEWLPVLEAGLAGLTVGVIPPALDQVLVGSVDRSRNPDLRLAIVLGLNDGVFPAPPPAPPILTEREREEFSDALAADRNRFGLSHRDRLAHERYFAYISCTRSRERLVLSWARADAKGRALNPSPFVSVIRRLFPAIQPQRFEETDWRQAEHLTELAPVVARAAGKSVAGWPAWPEFAPLLERAKSVFGRGTATTLSGDLARRLYGNPFRTSVSALEQFAACPFRFFLSKGLGLEERLEFEVDARERGKFQHEILSEFHAQVAKGGRRWRDLSPSDAAALVGKIGDEKLSTFGEGVFDRSAQRRFEAETLIRNLQRLVRTLVEWMAQYCFDPAQVELAFGFEKDSMPGWSIDLGNGRALLLCGRIDRVDLCPRPDGQGHLAVVVDYKSSGRKLDNTGLRHGLDLQLLSYLGWLRQAPAGAFGAEKLVPAGVFYVGLKPQSKPAKSRSEAIEDVLATQRKAFQHAGRFDITWEQFFSANGGNEQFNLRGRSDPCDAASFSALVEDVERHLREFGNRILDGAIEIAPYQKGSEVACSRCEFISVCRFDPWTQPYRVLADVPGKGKA